ncbi:acyl-CoA synthetase [Limibacter armeniacum]|uniref:acyl-CoA synthetase n=1 Tax=Limibacter armeniacum TaxID=466084 RepID=UPI002FE4FD74
MLDLVERAKRYSPRTALCDKEGSFTYQQLLQDSSKVAASLLAGSQDLSEKTIAFLAPSSYAYVVMQWGIWRAGGIAVPLCVSHPKPEMQYVLEDAKAELLLFHESFQDRVGELANETGVETLSYYQAKESKVCQLPDVDLYRRAMMIYTSGTTGKPKGVVTTHANIMAQVQALTDAWEWGADDYILNVLPLHHVHGVVNVLTCAMWSGAKCMMLPRFDAKEVWQLFGQEPFTVFMAVPTIYSKLIQYFDQASEEEQRELKMACSKMRLMVSGSAALPVSVMKKWEEISGHFLLERYGMTEIGMALSNPYHETRQAGCVGKPLPGVKVRVLNEAGAAVGTNEVGELYVKSDTVFLEYWNRVEETQKAFLEGGWFRTGDMVEFNEEGVFKIVGRKSVDIIKTGGYKVSALEIEEVLRQNEQVAECAVVGIPDEEWGQVIAAAIVPKEEKVDTKVLEDWLKGQLASYKVPKKYLLVDDLPRNAMGKVMKPKVVTLFK